MIDKVKQYIKENKLLEERDSVILGVSGGADSVCLLVVLYELSKIMALKLTAVHIHHGIRGEDALSDYLYVERLCKNFGIEFIGFHFDVVRMAKDEKLTVEEAGRKVRYETFEKVLKEKNADKIAVAHNRNDNAETILLNLFRGSGITGLTGIKPCRGNIIRPLLFADRKEIEDYLNSRNIEYRTDVTNNDTRYIRNKIRMDILPAVRSGVNSQAVGHIIDLSAQLNEVENYLDAQTDKKYHFIVKDTESGKELNYKELGILDGVIKKRIIRKALEEISGKLKDITKVHIEDILELFDKEVGKQISLPYGIVAKRTYDSVLLCHNKIDRENESYSINIDKAGTYILPDGGSISFSINNISLEEIAEDLYTKYFDYDKIEYVLSLRTRLEGDYLTIDSFNHIKKLKSYFIDNKIPKEDRANILLLADGSHILWVIGHRISNAYKVTERTTRVLKVHFDGGNNAG
jgi:tRNA(Ile)-lysidine synthase